MFKKQYFYILIFFLSFSTFGQNSDLEKVKINGSYLKSYWTDSKDILISPIRWKPKQWLAATAVVGTTILIYQYDSDIRNYFQSRPTTFGKNLSKYGLEPWGSGLYSFPMLALFYTQGSIWKNDRSKKVALLGVKAYVISGVLVNIPKYLINRHRPYHDHPANPNNFDGPSRPFYKSFPSGHTTSVFSVAAVIASEYKTTIWVPILSYSIASLSGLSRIYDDKHWASDVFFGAAFGWAIGKLVHTSRNWKVQTFPLVTNESAGLYMTYQF